jgi:hypothetical protein
LRTRCGGSPGAAQPRSVADNSAMFFAKNDCLSRWKGLTVQPEQIRDRVSSSHALLLHVTANRTVNKQHYFPALMNKL